MGMGMTSELVTSSSPGDRQPDAPSKSLARRWAAWASNLLVSGIILIVGIAFAREVTQWWRTDETGKAEPVVGAVASQTTATAIAADQLLEFGDFPFLLHRSEVNGDVDAVLAQLRATCSSLMQHPHQLDSEVSAAENRMLAACDKLQPVEASLVNGSIYQLEAPLPMVVGVRDAAPRIADAKRRVVSWGMAFPVVRESKSGGSSWTLFSYSRGSSAGDRTANAMIPAPSFGRRVLSLQTKAQEMIAVYRGEGAPRDWMVFYDSWCEANLWQPENDWQTEGETWRRRFSHEAQGSVDLLLLVDEGPRMRAIAVHNPTTERETR